MPRFVFLAAASLLLAASAWAQKAIDPATVLKVCGPDSPPPCATTPPKVKYAPDPLYTREARDLGLEGTVVLHLVVGADGRTHNIMVARALGHGLDEQAIEAVRKWKFKPATNHGAPVPVAINIEINFHL